MHNSGSFIFSAMDSSKKLDEFNKDGAVHIALCSSVRVSDCNLLHGRQWV